MALETDFLFFGVNMASNFNCNSQGWELGLMHRELV